MIVKSTSDGVVLCCDNPFNIQTTVGDKKVNGCSSTVLLRNGALESIQNDAIIRKGGATVVHPRMMAHPTVRARLVAEALEKGWLCEGGSHFCKSCRGRHFGTIRKSRERLFGPIPAPFPEPQEELSEDRSG